MTRQHFSPVYIVLVSVHGRIRGHALELGADADTGGQTRYVVELARALAARDDVARVDLITRRIDDPALSADYAVPVEALGEKARIVRLPCGPAGYLPKEALWPHLPEFAQRLTDWLRRQSMPPAVIHGHYADAGEVAVKVADALAVPVAFTGHSLGRDKQARLRAAGLGEAELEARYCIGRRIVAEEAVLARADLVVASTAQERDDQYAAYRHADPRRITVIPPGIDLARFHPGRAGIARARALLAPFLRDPARPLILALARPDTRKNLVGLLRAYGRSGWLRRRANLAIVAGQRDDIRTLGAGPQAVWQSLLLEMDALNLWGRVALPKHHGPDDVPGLYRLAASTGGVFVNPALTEPFGLTLLEAGACGLPVVATRHGGAAEIVARCGHGLSVDPTDEAALVGVLRTLLVEPVRWQRCAEQGPVGVAAHYGWSAHAERYRAALAALSPARERAA